MKKVLGSVFILGLAALAITTISAKPVDQQNLHQRLVNDLTESFVSLSR